MDRGIQSRLRKIKCLVCLGKECGILRDEGKISVEDWVELTEKIEVEIMKSSNRWRIVCSTACYQEMQEIVKANKEMYKEKKCLNSKCGHTEKMHVLNGNCTAARCACDKFWQESVQQIPKVLEEQIAEAEAGYKTL